MAKKVAILLFVLVISLGLLMDTSTCEGARLHGAMQSSVDVKSIKVWLHDLSVKRARRGVMEYGFNREVPSGPDGQHHNQPPSGKVHS